MVLVLFLLSFIYADLDSTDLLQGSSIFAVPPIFGYSLQEGLEKFPNFYYPPCSDKFISLPKERLSINYKTNELELLCPQNSTPLIVVPTDQEIQLPDPRDIKFHTNRTVYESPLTVENWVEYALGVCSSKSLYGIEERFLKPRFKESTFTSRKKLKNNHKPMIILFISADSFSRRHFYRKLKHTIDYFKDLKDYLVYDFKLHNIIGSDTAANQIHVFGDPDQSQRSSEKDALGDSAIWKILKNLDFMTMWGTDGCSSNVPKVLGNSPDVDHVIATFFCANKLYSKYRTDKDHKFEQRCMGSKMSHSYLMNYTQEFSLQYSGANQWIYNHFTAAHEYSGQHSQTLDLDLKQYVEWYLKKFGEEAEVIVFVNGDHGMRYNEHMSKVKGIQEYRLPASFIIAGKEFLRKIGAEGVLEHNSWRLNSKPDLRESMLYLAHWQNDKTYTKYSNKALNLFQEKISDQRTCDDAGIPPWYCCYIILDKHNVYKGNINKQVLEDVKENVLFQANSEILARYGRGGKVWQDCVIFQVFSAEVPGGKKDFVVRIVFSCGKISARMINVWVYLSKKRVSNEEVMKSSFFLSFPLLVGFEKYFCKVVHLSGDDII